MTRGVTQTVHGISQTLYINGCRCDPCLLFVKNYRLLRKYGITPEQLEQMYENQEGRCASYGDQLWDKPQIDHNHTMGKVRELLCITCNVALGMLSEDPEKILKLHAYLVKHS